MTWFSGCFLNWAICPGVTACLYNARDHAVCPLTSPLRCVCSYMIMCNDSRLAEAFMACQLEDDFASTCGSTCFSDVDELLKRIKQNARQSGCANMLLQTFRHLAVLPASHGLGRDYWQRCLDAVHGVVFGISVRQVA